jgi:hypothetical protein
MKSPRRPPLLATWLLDHLVPGVKNEALVGDLLEDFHRRQSVTWYWRQVFMAVLSGSLKELGTRAGGILFAIVYSSIFPGQQLWQSLDFNLFAHWGLELAWPLSQIYALVVLSIFDGAALLVALGIYGVHLAVKGMFDLRSFLKGALLAVLVLSLGIVGETFLSVLHLPHFFLVYVLWRLPLFFGLVLGMWVALPSSLKSEVKKVSA